VSAITVAWSAVAVCFASATLGGVMRLLRPTIISHIEQIAREQKQSLAPLGDDVVLADSGLDSLSFAILVARLEDELGLDPFTTSTEAHYPITLGDFVRFYEDASHRHQLT